MEKANKNVKTAIAITPPTNANELSFSTSRNTSSSTISPKTSTTSSSTGASSTTSSSTGASSLGASAAGAADATLSPPAHELSTASTVVPDAAALASADLCTKSTGAFNNSATLFTKSLMMKPSPQQL